MEFYGNRKTNWKDLWENERERTMPARHPRKIRCWKTTMRSLERWIARKCLKENKMKRIMRIHLILLLLPSREESPNWKRTSRSRILPWRKAWPSPLKDFQFPLEMNQGMISSMILEKIKALGNRGNAARIGDAMESFWFINILRIMNCFVMLQRKRVEEEIRVDVDIVVWNSIRLIILLTSKIGRRNFKMLQNSGSWNEEREVYFWTFFIKMKTIFSWSFILKNLPTPLWRCWMH